MFSSRGDGYLGPAYELTSSVVNLRRLPRFGYGYDFTAIISPDQAAQVDYTTGLGALSIFLLIFFLMWSITLLVFKIMGPGNAGFLSGHPFMIPDPVDDEKNIYKRPFRVRIVFLVASVLLMIFAFLFVVLGVSNVDNATATMGKSIQTAEELMQYTNEIATELDEVGRKSMEIRDIAVEEIKNICPDNPDIADITGIDVLQIADQAKSDLTMLATFIKDGLETLKKSVALVRIFLNNVDDGIESIDFWGWQMKLLAACLFILPSFLIVGVGLVMLDLDVKPYQLACTYGIMPLFTLTVIATYVFCSVTLPLAAASADACTGGGEIHGGPDDTLLTSYRNLRGNDEGILFLFVMFYTQQCLPKYYPFETLDGYFGDLQTAISSTDSFVDTIGNNLSLLEQQCGRQFNGVLHLISGTNQNLRVLEDQASLAMDLFQCKNINDLYVNTVHEAGCTYSVNAIAWMLACSIIISVCGLIMIMLRSSYIPEQFLIMSSEWNTKPAITSSASEESRSSNAGDQGISLGVPSHITSTEIQNSQQRSGVPQSVPMPSTPPRMFIDCNSNSVECSSELNSQQKWPISSAAINSNDDSMMMPGSAEI
mmetsp:Transcript_3788/g.5810  ORF Transcript_3788/g.5810 Transcript_3788/m.5810 type:complete len:597 (+) Transcript_3788:228-2018(+)|eukprot:CAMPEP_0201718690 /NCGR_PEP_ID=MMETSP0593-20130828/4155_1 /ASSEMBLY_ACC=CAM_ASM_000672 /TAXON_ID=267983 /ORGANISM="Skeletonema japonicum, Strain CCMP2506" /LENGTH=596 /DNA_ID=CAMNT_0048209049 /DNA_START=153 /DNA_END=1943 /DNA_ORIENTATION=+